MKYYTPDHYTPVAAMEMLVDNEEDWIILPKATESHYLLTGAAQVELLDVDAARTNGYYVIRSDYPRAGPYTQVALAKDSGYIFSRMSNPDKRMDTKMRDIAIQTARNLGIDAHPDAASTKSNDALVDGQKWLGYASRELDNGDLYFGAFVAVVNDYEMFKYISIPSEVFDEKMYDSVNERVTSLSEHDSSVTFEDFRAEFKTTFQDSTGRTLTNESFGYDADSRHSVLTSDDEVFRV